MAAPTGVDAWDFSLLTTKLFIPPTRPDLVPRPRLIERLNAGFGGKLTLVSAPAGFGKTTLLSEWVRRSGLPIAWLSLDEGDNDLARFWTYVIAAIQEVHAGVGQAALAMLRSPQPPPTQVILTELINEIVLLAAPFVLVLDDFHVISEQQIHTAFLFLLNNLPPKMHVALSTRADPPWPLSRFRTRGQMAEVRVEDLRFNLEEVAAFLNNAMGLSLSPEQVAVLDDRTEGWIGGLQMAALSVQGRGDISDFVRAFSGSNRFVLDYLMEEVLQRQPDHIQTFLLHTCVLDSLCGPLCDAVMDEGRMTKDESPTAPAGDRSSSSVVFGSSLPPSQAILEYLEAANLFIVPLDERREWYRYHRLFADSLRRRLYQASARGKQPGLVPELHRRASAWYERRAASIGEHELMMAAIEHALAAEDFERAADVMERGAEAILMQSYVATFRGWVERIPDEVVRARPALSYLYSFALLLSGYTLDAAKARLQDVDSDDDARGAALRALVAVSQGQLREAVESSQLALRRLPESELISRALAMWILSISQTATSDVWTQSQALDEVVRMGQESGSPTVTVAALCYQAALCMRLGQLHKSKAMFEQALETATTGQGRVLPVAGEAMMGLGELYREWNDLEAATRYLEGGIALTERWRPIAALNGYISLARVRQAYKDTDGAQGIIQKALQLAKGFDAAEWDDQLVALEQARLWLSHRNASAAWQWVQENGLDKHLDSARQLENDDAVSQHMRKYEQRLLARALMAKGRHREALALLESLQRQMEVEGRLGMVIEIQVLRALACQAQGDVDRAMTLIESALSLAEPEGYVRIFVDEGAPMAALLHKCVLRGIMPDYGAKLRAAFEAVTKDEGRTTEDGITSSVRLSSPVVPVLGPGTQVKDIEGLVEPLSERELEVLHLVADGLTNQEIAHRLVIALSTVKTHAHNIYGKLGVSNRVQAVARAQELNIL